MPMEYIYDMRGIRHDQKKDMEDEIALMQDESLWQKKFPGKESAASGN